MKLCNFLKRSFKTLHQKRKSIDIRHVSLALRKAQTLRLEASLAPKASAACGHDYGHMTSNECFSVSILTGDNRICFAAELNTVLQAENYSDELFGRRSEVYRIVPEPVQNLETRIPKPKEDDALQTNTCTRPKDWLDSTNGVISTKSAKHDSVHRRLDSIGQYFVWQGQILSRLSNSAGVEYFIISGVRIRIVFDVSFCVEYQKGRSEPNEPEPPRVGVQHPSPGLREIPAVQLSQTRCTARASRLCWTTFVFHRVLYDGKGKILAQSQSSSSIKIIRFFAFVLLHNIRLEPAVDQRYELTV
ncbi:hypothetical protein NA56DRAFT_705686 [Hyaloscypha hepaticicola]|uniref:Uncharacterized protein n=1 Tax=Hyaloscypha hepaticicola TaxID=2082293 RepID=A0A2J6Q026_9HELO|nr:hypothetical protein NA56DRAFT_705686 [Hyaloscypha hepaticicola]